MSSSAPDLATAYAKPKQNNLEAELIIADEMEELERDEVELFDDYLEYIMTYGYITVFAAADKFKVLLFVHSSN